MVANENATDNANQIIKDLTLEYKQDAPRPAYQRIARISTAQMAVS